MMCSRKPALVDPFSSKAELDCMPYRKEELGITNPILWKPVSRNKSQNQCKTAGFPKRLMPEFPKRQGQEFELDLGQRVSLSQTIF